MMTGRPVSQATRLRVLVPAEASELAALRHTQREWAANLGLPKDIQELLLLAVQEAAANVVEHAYWTSSEQGTLEVTLWVESGSVYVTVTDRGSWRPPSTEPSFRGYGTNLMRSLVDHVSIDAGPDGTTVYLRHRI